MVELGPDSDYAQNMKIKHRLLLLSSAALLGAGAANAQFYKSVDEQGNIVYSDTPTPGAEQLTPPPISTVPSPPRPEPKAEAEAKPGEEGDEAAKKPPTRYTKFAIASPGNEATIWDNSGAVPVALQLEPPLDKENGHSIWVYVGGKAVVRKSQNLVQQLSGIDRGAHKIRAEVRDSNRKTLKRTQNITVHMKRASAIPRSGP